jgi:hypothetical protein
MNPIHKCIITHWYGFDFIGMFTVEAEHVYTGYYYWAFQGYILNTGASPERPLNLASEDGEIVFQ